MDYHVVCSYWFQLPKSRGVLSSQIMKSCDSPYQMTFIPHAIKLHDFAQ